jgi:hypothetical protein
MTAARRWCLVGIGVVMLLLAPVALRSWPVPDSDESAASLLQRLKASGGVAYSGYAESVGSLQLPVSDQFSELAHLLGDRTVVVRRPVPGPHPLAGCAAGNRLQGVYLLVFLGAAWANFSTKDITS